jgi:cell division control protein 45
MRASNQRVVVVDDDQNEVRVPIESDDDLEDSEDNADSDGEKENHWDPDQPGGVQPPLERLAAKRQRRAEREERRSKKSRRVDEYYENAYYATPTAISLFKMARQTNDKLTELLWVAAVALTAYYDQELMQKMDYERLAWDELKSKLDNITDFVATADESGSTQDGPDVGLIAPGSPLAPGSPVHRGRRLPGALSTEQRTVRFQQELRLTLQRHWNLEESIMHSAYFYGTMELYRDKGQRSLKNFFVTAGIPVKEYKQQYSGVSLPIQKRLHQLFREHGRSYGLQESSMFVEQFVRVGRAQDEKNALFLHELSSIDAANVITTILASVPSALSGTRLDSLPQLPDGSVDREASAKIENEKMVENFWKAFDAVLCREPSLMREAVAEAVTTVKQIASMGRMLKDSKGIQQHPSRNFLWCKLEYPPQQFRHPMNIRRLGVWLLQVLFIYRPRGEGPERPLLVIVRDRVRSTYLLVGVTPARFNEPDDFGNKFRKVVETDPSLRYDYHFFDKSCIEINAEDFDRFWDILSSHR